MKPISTFLIPVALACLALPTAADASMDRMWGDRSTKNGVESSERAALFRDGNTLNAAVLDRPEDRRICLPGTDGNPVSATLIRADGGKQPVPISKADGLTVLDASAVADAATTAAIASVIEVKFNP